MGEPEDEVNVAHFLLDLDLLELYLLNNDGIVYCCSPRPIARIMLLPDSFKNLACKNFHVSDMMIGMESYQVNTCFLTDIS